jgi:hypothetical protein
MLKSGGEVDGELESGEEVGLVLKSEEGVERVIVKPSVLAEATLSEQGRAKGVMNHVALIDFDVRYVDCLAFCRRLGDARAPTVETSYAGRTTAAQILPKLHVKPGCS